MFMSAVLALVEVVALKLFTLGMTSFLRTYMKT
jgi:hypothetical protein